MPPKRRAPASSSASTPAPKRRSALAREHNLSAAQETAIREAFSLFASTDDATLLARADARRVMIALGHHLSPADVAEMGETLDPEGEGWVGFETFFAYAAVWALRGDGGKAEGEEVGRAFALFAQGRGRITLGDLRRVAGELREEVEEGVLWDMVLEANGEGRSREGVARGVSVEEFEGVMRRAGVFG